MKRSSTRQSLLLVALAGSLTVNAQPPPSSPPPAAPPPAGAPPASISEAAPPPAQIASTLSGKAVNTETKKPVADVVVTLSAPALGVELTEVTDSKGAYRFPDLAPGQYVLRFEGAAYQPYSQIAKIVSGKNLSADVELLPDTLVSEEVVVTGTRVPRLEVGRAAPVTTVNRAQIQQSGQASVGDILQKLPEQTGGTNTQVNNGGDGSTRINLRGLGSNRTLVLLNGRRMVPGGSGANSTVDLNTIPTSAISRVEVLKDGASAVYGSDAIAGVVNIITRNDFNGVEVNAYTGLSQRGDGLLYDLSFTTGRTTDRGDVLFSAAYTGQHDVFAGNRPFSKYDRSGAAYDWPSGQIATLGSSAIPNGRFQVPTGQPGNAAWQALIAKYPNQRQFTIANDGQWRPFNSNGITDAGGDFFNYQPDNYLVTPQRRVNLFSVGSLKLIGSARGYYEALYTHRESEQLLAPEPLFTSQEEVLASKDSYYNPWGVDFTTVNRRLVEFGRRTFNQDLDTFRLVTGVRGSFLPKWTWDLSVNYGRTQGVSSKAGLLQRSKLASALGPSYLDPADGVVKCGTPDAPIPDCVPMNIYGGAGHITPEMKDYVSYKGTGRGYTQQLTFAAATASELFKIPSAASPSGFALGYENRREEGAAIEDPLTNKGDTTGNKGTDTQGSYSVNEAYGELNVPLLKRFGAGQEGNFLEANAAARLVSYNTFGSNVSYKLGGRLSPVKDITLRGTVSTAFRAPNVGELYSGTADGFPGVQDPCANRTPDTPIDAACDAQGVPDDLDDDRAQLRTRGGGNPNLKPETAQALTLGLAVEPRFAPDLSLTVDFYNISVRNSITTVGADLILSSCYPTSGNKPAYCDRIHRDADGLIRDIDNPISNVGGDQVSGIDFALDYMPQTPIGVVGASLNVNHLLLFNTELADGRIIRAKGTYDLSQVMPDWKINGGLSWANRGFNAGLNVRFIGGYKECEDNNCQVPTDPQAAPALSRRVEAYATADLNLGYRISYEGGAATQIAFGVNNLLDKQPVYIVNGLSSASDPTAYDFMGRYFFLRVAHEFQ